ncbi:unnamed protein product [Bursaphelenchus xylophilus]|uniref:(pine wood nematode) hypothetical protein n=1 Tax=Bursaphelenchus xylophilus TaxID=6326 RepID=A0A7I8WMB5_BURXY|nr:unnamed protein product [Bursaphelenchus xylophilus]CAG9104279.1 unnamed protein product [Bursaphelenchus xylophilus]
MRGDIQGLRCIAIVAVLLFHLWPQTLENGYLGVDMFFVISGFLMHAVLEKKDTSPRTMLDFYFRRIRRIWPTYYFILTMTILAVPYFFVATDYKTILKELLGAATFTSNIFNLPFHGYFDAININSIPLFLHTWSLSVEMQFYLLVPFIFYVYRWCTKSRTQWLFIGALMAASLLHQLVNINNANTFHMAFFGRVWQFMVGFIIFTHSPLSPRRPPEKSEGDRSTARKWMKYCLTVLLLLQLIFPTAGHHFTDRILCTLTMAAVIYFREETVLDHKVLQQIGDISYSLYLTHWPIIMCTKYITLSWNEEAPFRDGVFCIFMALLSALVVESVFKKLTACIDSFFALSACLLLIFTVLAAAAFNVMTRIENPYEPYVAQLDFANQTRAFFHNPAKPNMTEAELLAYNVESNYYFYFDVGQKFQDAKGRFNLSNEYWEGKWYGSFEGNGTKNILIIGNSISRDVFYGMVDEWRDVYKRLTTYYVNRVVPFQNVPGTDAPKHDFLGFLEQFEHPIDILIVRNTYYTLKPDYIQGPMFKEMQNFYSKLNKYAKQAVIMDSAEMTSQLDVEKYKKIVADKQSPDILNLSYKELRKSKQMLNQVISSVKCPKCIQVDLTRAFCDHFVDTCYVVEPNGLLLFRDSVHASYLGCLHLGRHLREELQLRRAVLMLTLLALYSMIAGFSYYGSQFQEYQSQLHVDGPFQNDEKQVQGPKKVRPLLNLRPKYNVHGGRVPKAKPLAKEDAQRVDETTGAVRRHLPYGSGRRVEMGACPPIYGKISVFVAYRKEEYDTKYKIAQASLQCYLKSTNYTLYLVDLYNDPEVKMHCRHREIFFLKHCAAAIYLRKSDWMLVLDADTAVVNPNHCIEEYVDDRVDLVFYERFFNWEIMSGNYLVKNTAFARDFLMKWANYEFTQPDSWNGADNGALQIHILNTVLPEAISERNACYKVWKNATSYDNYMGYVTCVKLMLGAQRLYPGQLRILRRAHGMARDGFLVYDSFCEADFMFHAYKQNEIGEEKWESPWKKPMDLEECGTGYNGWYWRKTKKIPCSEIRYHLANFEQNSARTFPKEGRVFPHLELPDVGGCWPNCDNY